MTKDNPVEKTLIADAMRQALRNQARSVAVVAMRKGEEPVAMTATAVTEVSLDPPSMLVCLNRSSRMGAMIEEGDAFAVNLLSAGQSEYSQACGGGVGAERFALAGWQSGDGPPTINDACAAMHLRAVRVIDHGSHRIVIGDVEVIDISADAEPLIYHAGGYRNLAERNN